MKRFSMEDNEEEFYQLEKEIIRMKKIAKWGSILFITCIVVLLVYGVFKIDYMLFRKEKTLISSKSPNQINELDIKEVGSNFGPGNAPIKIYYGKVGSSLSPYKIEHFSNNGATLSNENIKIKWINDQHVMLTLSGKEQKDEAVKIDVK